MFRQRPVQEPNYRDAFFVVESVCVSWFIIELLLRFVSCPSKRSFCRDIMNIFDVLAIVPFFVTLATMQVRRPKFEILHCALLYFIYDDIK